MEKEAYEIAIESSIRSQTTPPNQYVPEEEKTPDWYFKNLNYILGFYNQPQQSIDIYGTQTTVSGNSPSRDLDMRNYPVQYMLRMMSYYLGEQPNMTYNHLTKDIATTNFQAQWIKGQDVSEFVNYFKGLIMERISNLKFSAIPMSKEATSKREDFYNALMLKFDLKHIFEQMAAKGTTFSPEGSANFEMPEDIAKFMDTNFKEFGAIVNTQLANGLWFNDDWSTKALQCFMYCVITSMCAMEHYVSNGRTHCKVRLPYQLIIDNRFDHDYGKEDQFIGVIEPMTPEQIFSDNRFILSHAQKLDIQEMAKSGELGGKYNTSSNILWWNYGGKYNNTVTVSTVYFRGIQDTGKKKTKSVIGKDFIAEGNYGEDGVYLLPDIYKATIIGNKYLTAFGLVDNTVEDPINKSKLILPIIRFRPNTFLGQSKSEVSRIYKIQDEMDMIDYKIRDMIGKAKGKVYIVSDKLAQSLPKEFIEDISTTGVHFAQTASEYKDQNGNKPSVELIDWSLDPNIGQLSALYKERKDRMGNLLSASEITRGQQTKYVGLGVLNGTINQNSYGVAYLVNGFMDFLVLNMRYEVNMAKNLYAKYERKDLPFLIGDRGMAYLSFSKNMLFEYLWIELTVNNVLDAKKKERILSIAQAEAQNGRLSTSDYLKLEDADSSLEVQEYFEYKDKKNQKKAEDSSAKMAQMQQQMAAMEQQFKAQLEQLKQDSANFRTIYTANLAAATKGLTEELKNMPPQPTSSTLIQPPQQQQPMEQQQGQPQMEQQPQEQMM